jgi:hypothetical protein
MVWAAGFGRFRYLASELEMNWCMHIFVLKAFACQESLRRFWLQGNAIHVLMKR